MTTSQIAPVPAPTPEPAADSAAATRDAQRQGLDQIVKLSIDCTAAEQRIEQEHTGSLAAENTDYQKKVVAAKQRLSAKSRRTSPPAPTQRDEALKSRYDNQRFKESGNHNPDDSSAVDAETR